MAIFPQSRYNNSSRVTCLPNSSGVFNLSILRRTPPSTASYKLYIWTEIDRPDIVAYQQLGDPNLWWAIFDINPELIYPINLMPGTIVRIPVGPIMGHGTLVQ